MRGDDYGKCWGYWTSEFGTINQAWHLWSYESLDARTHARAALAKNERWNKEYVPVVQPMLQRQDIRFLNPVVGRSAAGAGRRLRTADLPHASRQGRPMGAGVQGNHAGSAEIFEIRRHLDR